MLNKRLILGQLAKLDTSPWANARVVLELQDGSYTYTTQLPSDTLVAYTDAEGYIYSTFNSVNTQGVYLWVNTEGQEDTRYLCTLPDGKTFQFVVPASDFSPVQLSILRNSSLDSNPPSDMVLTYIDDRLASATKPTQVFSGEYTTAEAISALRLVAINGDLKLELANIDNYSYPILGLTLVAYAQDVSAIALVTGMVTDPGWTWVAGQPLFLGANGELTQTSDYTKDNLIKVGYALTSTAINIEPPKQVKLSN